MEKQRERLLLVAMGCLILVGLAGCGRQTPASYTQPGYTTASEEGMDRYTVGMAGNQFRPQTMTAAPGQTITFLNNCSQVHTVTPDAATTPGGPNSDTEYPQGLQPGQTYQWTVPTNAALGSAWYYHCRFHGKPGSGTALGTGMAGSIVAAAADTTPAANDDTVPGTASTPGVSTGTGATGTTRSTGAGTAGTNRGTAPGATTSSGTGGTGNAERNPEPPGYPH